MKKIIIGNWKLNGSAEMLSAMLNALAEIKTDNTVVLCPPFPLIAAARVSSIAFGGQDCAAHSSGAFTGDTSAAMLKEAGARYVIIGHSERRRYQGETDDIVSQKAEQALDAGLIPIICVGENLGTCESDADLSAVENQVRACVPESDKGKKIIIAYEPVWAIGTGKAPTTDYIKKVAARIASVLKSMEFYDTVILYGGGVNESNVADIMSVSNIGGVMVGSAALKTNDFISIINYNKYSK